MLQPSATYQIAAGTETTVGYVLTRDALDGGATLVSQTATSTLQHRRSDRDVLGLGYTYQRYGFGLFGSAEVRPSQTVSATAISPRPSITGCSAFNIELATGNRALPNVANV